MHAIYIAGSDLPHTSHHVPTTEDARRLGADGCGSEVQDASAKPNVAAKLTRRVGNSFLPECLKTKSTISEPAKRECNPEQTSLLQTLCTRHCIYITPPGNTETYKMFKRRLYNVLHIRETRNEEPRKCESLRNTRPSFGHAYGPLCTRLGHPSD